MSDAVVRIDTGRDFGSMTSEQLEHVLNNLTPDGDVPPEAPPQVEAVEDAPSEPEQEAEPEAEPDPEPEVEIDIAASEREIDRNKIDKLEASLLLQQAHASRLAGEIGYLKNQRPLAASEPYEPQSQVEVDRLALLEQRFAESEARRVVTEVSQVVDQSIGALDGPWVDELASEIAAIAPKYKDQIEFARSSTDPEMARQIATAVAMVVKAEATQARLESRHATLVEKKASTRANSDKAKRAAAPSASGAVPAAAPKTKTYADMTAAEADAWLRENVP